MMLVRRICYWINLNNPLNDTFLYSHHFFCLIDIVLSPMGVKELSKTLKIPSSEGIKQLFLEECRCHALKFQTWAVRIF